jgi:hypothetical protein
VVEQCEAMVTTQNEQYISPGNETLPPPQINDPLDTNISKHIYIYFYLDKSKSHTCERR